MRALFPARLLCDTTTHTSLSLLAGQLMINFCFLFVSLLHISIPFPYILYILPYIYQLNGVELPCGSILSVEPADMDYKNKDELKKKSSNSSNINMTRTDEHEIGTISSTATSVLKDDRVGLNMAMDDRSAEEEKGGDDDLDDFFASLE